MPGLIDSLRSRLQARPAARQGLRQAPGESDPRPIVFVTLLTAPPGRAERALADHRESRTRRVVVVTTATDIRGFAEAGLLVEHIPDADALALDQADAAEAMRWLRYVEIRWLRLHRKWRPHWTVNYGLEFETYLNGLRTSTTVDAG